MSSAVAGLGLARAPGRSAVSAASSCNSLSGTAKSRSRPNPPSCASSSTLVAGSSVPSDLPKLTIASGATGVSAVAKAARAEKVPPAQAKAAYMRAPYKKPALKYLYAMGWIGGTKNPGQCGLTLLGQDAAKDQTVRQIRSNPKLMTQLRKRAVSVGVAASALVKGVVSACA